MIDQKDIHIGTHGEKYGNWMSNPFLGMIGGIATIAVILMALFFAVWHITLLGVLFAVLLAAKKIDRAPITEALFFLGEHFIFYNTSISPAAIRPLSS